MLTVFSTPKPFEGKIGLLQRNAIRSWIALDPSVQVLLVGDEPGAREACDETGAVYVGSVDRNELGTPLISSIFQMASRMAEHELMCFVNADILLTPSLLAGSGVVRSRFDDFLIVGQRWDVEIEDELDLGYLADETLRGWLEAKGVLHKPSGSDYFVYRRGTLEADMPDFALGRSGWDNWMIYSARSRRVPVIDASSSILVVHQNHDYRHLPGGRIHFGLPESERNVRLGGGRETVFTLRDATHRLTDGRVERIGVFERGPIRTLETAAYSRLTNSKWRQLTRLALHPFETIRYFTSRPQVPNAEAQGNRRSGPLNG